MANPSVKLFLSCVSGEFGDDRDALRHELTGRSVEVKIQEDFGALGVDTLSKLDAYIEACDAVVHLVGEITGSTPPPASVAEYLRVRPDLKTRLPALATALDAGERIAYT